MQFRNIYQVSNTLKQSRKAEAFGGRHKLLGGNVILAIRNLGRLGLIPNHRYLCRTAVLNTFQKLISLMPETKSNMCQRWQARKMATLSSTRVRAYGMG